MEASLGDAWDEDQEDAWAAFCGLLLAVVGRAYQAGATCRLAAQNSLLFSGVRWALAVKLGQDGTACA